MCVSVIENGDENWRARERETEIKSRRPFRNVPGVTERGKTVTTHFARC